MTVLREGCGVQAIRKIFGLNAFQVIETRSFDSLRYAASSLPAYVFG